MKHKKLVGKKYTWYVGMIENEADEIYVDPADPKSDGFAGRTLNFELEDGTVDKVKGPWHSNSSALLEDTEYDIKDKHHTKVVISYELLRQSSPLYDKQHYPLSTPHNIIYKESDFNLGVFDRGEEMAQELANTQNVKVYYTITTKGGRSQGFKGPQAEEDSNE